MTRIVAAHTPEGRLLVGADRRLVNPFDRAVPPLEDVEKLFPIGSAPGHVIVAVHGDFVLSDPMKRSTPASYDFRTPARFWIDTAS